MIETILYYRLTPERAGVCGEYEVCENAGIAG
jgi:hypothetical protein